jgi:hypothetical protein
MKVLKTFSVAPVATASLLGSIKAFGVPYTNSLSKTSTSTSPFSSISFNETIRN